MQQLISILPSKHAGACVVAAKANFRNVCLSCILDNQKRRNDHNRGLSESYKNLSCSKTGKVTLGFITPVV